MVLCRLVWPSHFAFEWDWPDALVFSVRAESLGLKTGADQTGYIRKLSVVRRELSKRALVGLGRRQGARGGEVDNIEKRCRSRYMNEMLRRGVTDPPDHLEREMGVSEV